MYVHAGAGAVLAGNRVHGYGRSGVEAVGWNTSVTMAGNEIAEGSGCGVFVRNAAHV